MEKVSTLESSLELDNTADCSVVLAAGEVLIGRLEAIDEAGSALVSLPHMPLFQQRIALTTIPILPQHIGRQVALMFTQGADPKPIITGLIYSPLQQVLESMLTNAEKGEDLDELVFAEPLVKSAKATQSSAENSIYIDGKQLVLEGQEEVVLRCGEASITLNQNGKISIRGKYLLSRATGVNRILGGSVQVN
jgi:hypothetical protein